MKQPTLREAIIAKLQQDCSRITAERDALSERLDEMHEIVARNYCTHYAPKPGAALRDDYCALGCNASQRMKDARAAGEPNMTPCLGGHTTPNVLTLCPKWERRSLEHAEKRADGIERSMRRLTIAGPVIGAWRKKEPRGKAEVIECPVCKGRLHLAQSAYNGHVRARCETKNCIDFIE